MFVEHRDEHGPRRLTGDLLAGVTFVAIGAVFIALGRDLRFGSVGQPGPGFLPVLLSVILIALGSALVLSHLLAKGSGEGVTRPKARPFLAAIGLFAFTALIEPAGASGRTRAGTATASMTAGISSHSA